MNKLAHSLYQCVDRAVETRAASVLVEAVISTAKAFGSAIRDALCFAGLTLLVLATSGARVPDTFPFYVDGHLVDSVLLVSLLAGAGMTAIRFLYSPRSGGKPAQR